MKTTDSIMREKLENKIYSILYDHSCLSDGNIGVRVAHEDEWPIKELADLYSHSLAEARREWVEEMRGKANLIEVRSEARYLTDSGFWATKKLVAKDDVLDLLTGDTSEEAK